ncbi:MAG: hypothetical protein A2445_03760 [Candidatus Jacksonbacteria bacterium RIFOXYC2_FULL_44_29]|nr:MAG: hypothetical protein UW45_C0040G0005 [Parcubacteria group bacterium GW2011_GWC2_44_22]OGY74561.1 MAG: hypothetical protein A2240_02520 [Candidatus Jacksonbacteria bacterium RIFOXYA2_FULL_43_12]OGY77264.1 MAG: hypothetical protein A2445_03760 [Candidatus Jacksonbacteria bacterium RIFOXYC2_FULL_44_29]OGY77810.1 MAG: hypothetical protein A2295_04395 [Candidatus Jacksonbacteria bacterium RIFOXYB2_FULL_44_15]OGY78294.1 MAG: hypothetical protein A2550_03755 [Candidatus Jacksonbacteria bacteri
MKKKNDVNKVFQNIFEKYGGDLVKEGWQLGDGSVREYRKLKGVRDGSRRPVIILVKIKKGYWRIEVWESVRAIKSNDSRKNIGDAQLLSLYYGQPYGDTAITINDAPLELLQLLNTDLFRAKQMRADLRLSSSKSVKAVLETIANICVMANALSHDLNK